MAHYALSDFGWNIIEPIHPNKSPGVTRIDDSIYLNGIFWVQRFGAPWRDMSDRY
jgi:transposase